MALPETKEEKATFKVVTPARTQRLGSMMATQKPLTSSKARIMMPKIEIAKNRCVCTVYSSETGIRRGKIAKTILMAHLIKADLFCAGEVEVAI